MLLIAIALAPLVMFLAASAESRLGPAAGGWIAGLPIAFAVTLFAVARTTGAITASRVAASAAAHVSAQVAFGLIFGAVLVRWGLAAGGIAGVLGYVTASVAVAQMPQYAAIALGVAALAAATLLIPRQPSRTRLPRKQSATIVICLSAAVAVLGATLASRAAGPVPGGAVAAFPTTSATLAVAIAAQGKRNDAANVAFGLISSLPCFLVFALVVAAAAPHLGLYSYPIAAPSALAAAALTWRHMNSRVQRSATRELERASGLPSELAVQAMTDAYLGELEALAENRVNVILVARPDTLNDVHLGVRPTGRKEEGGRAGHRELPRPAQGPRPATAS